MALVPFIPRRPYDGPKRKLIIAFDVGTTYSGVSFVLLDPGVSPVIQGVTRFPGQQKVGGDSKIPSILCYDKTGSLRAVGEEAVQMHESVSDEVEDDSDWEDVDHLIKVEWFKLHLRPRNLAASHVTDADLKPLPPGKTALNVLADFLRYLNQCTRTYIEETLPSGPTIWQSVGNNIEFILTHPNGWEGAQQAGMRHAAVDAGLIPNENASDRIHFVTEGEASLHFCISKGAVQNDVVSAGEGIIVVDAGGGTIDISAYHKVNDGNSFEEIAQPHCLLQGSVLVSRRARQWLTNNLRGSKFGTVADIDSMTSIFDKSGKLTFKGPSNPCFIRFGSARDRDSSFDIRSGQKKIPGEAVDGFFSPSIEETLKSILEQREEGDVPISTVFLVGGFGASDWVFSELQRKLSALGIRVGRPDAHINKAVPDGAISFFLDHFVSTRVARLTYGTRVICQYDPMSKEHLARRETMFENVDGLVYIRNGFDTILSKGAQVSETKEFRRTYWQLTRYPFQFGTLHEEIVAYNGNDTTHPEWTDVNPERFKSHCTVVADVSGMLRSLKQRSNYRTGGAPYYEIVFDVVLCLGLTELKAQVCWKEEGQERRGPAQVIYDDE